MKERIFDLKGQGEQLIFGPHPTPPDAPIARGRLRLAPGALGPTSHRHTRQLETFKVTSGELIVIIDGREQHLRTGDTARVPMNAAHTFRNARTDLPVECEVSIEPALHFEWMLTEMARSAIRNGGSWKDLPLLEVGHMMHEMRGEYALAGMPGPVQHALFSVLHRLALITRANAAITTKASYYATTKVMEQVPEHVR
jgi:quercetin dioxygenase-like cupin family protein